MSRLLKIGELAREAGISVRTLHHYDQINLLKPKISESGHRIYGEKEVERLQKIISLKSMGFALKDIVICLNEDICDLHKTLTFQMEALDQKSEEIRKAQQNLRLLLSRFSDNNGPAVEELLQFIKDMKMMEQIYTPAQLQYLKERLEKYPEEVKEVEQAWPVLFREFEKAMKDGLKTEHPELGQLARKAQHFIDLFTGGDKAIEEKLDQAYAHNEENALRMWGVSREVFDYANRARLFHIKKIRL